MSSISSLAISNLAPLLFNSGSSLASAALTSPTVQAGLENSSAGDLVQLSDQALQLQEMEGLFAASSASSLGSLFSGFSAPGIATPEISSLFAPSDNVVSSLDNSLLSSWNTPANSLSSTSTESSNSTDASQQTGSNTSSNSSSPADPLAVYQADLLAQQTQALFGTGVSVTSGTSAVNLLA